MADKSHPKQLKKNGSPRGGAGPPRPNGRRGKIWMFQLNFNLKNVFIGLFILFILFSLLGSLGNQEASLPQKPLSTIINDVKSGSVAKIEVEEEKLLVAYKNGDKAISHKEPQESLYKLLEGAQVDPKSVEIQVKDLSVGQLWLGIISNVLPLVLTVLFFLFLFRQARGAQDNLFSFGQSKARIWNRDLPKVTFADVAGVDEAKKELEEVVDFLKNPTKYKALGARTPKGVILVGPSGTGKTLLAKAMAGEAKTAFYSIAGSEFMEMLVGVGAARVRDLFAQAKKNAPAIIFIDEIDAIGRMRSVGIMGGHDEREQTLNQILVEMDGFEPNTAVLIVAATNRGDLLDPALLRPGRFDRRVMLDLPDMTGRKAILAIHAKGKPFTSAVDWDKVSKRTVGFSGADIENMLNEAAIQAARGNKKEIDMADLEEAATKVKLGPEKKRLQTDTDRKMTAYHEAGHAIVNYFSPHLDPVHRISIVSRGMALGFTMSPPEKDRLHETRSRLIDQIAMTMGGRAAEQLIFNEMTSGAANDIDQATRIARYMVMEFGMSDLGPINFGPQMDVTEWGKSFMEASQISPEMLSKIDTEIQKFLNEGYKKAAEILKKHRKELDRIAEELKKKETIEGDEFAALMGGPKKTPAAN
ncbi:MAG: ATP-dependent zinc metalloprotease FtsH [Candidatus Gottesmanbacteria bacterium GW2011_GWB1_49_7]|uniref:ATP-dependent zinc metalloprotease FtsH n=1 Tax=Candidatus Gottesmanbacteria bacterium GW2011_GWB1_49_7 TaxID=1618448 RepID=A0A0G1YTQ1_9BACT|nr:MAG: ATP-dependent zinc metalloprotease FtsH [Candidatus Gottesmanbacteria bacterium GW2011_GWB1_49_7]